MSYKRQLRNCLTNCLYDERRGLTKAYVNESPANPASTVSLASNMEMPEQKTTNPAKTDVRLLERSLESEE